MRTTPRLLLLAPFACALTLAALAGTAHAQGPAPDPGSTPLQDIVALISAHGWLPLFALALLYVRKLCSPDSKFPIPVPAQWLPTVSAFFGLLYGLVSSIEKGTALGTAVLTCVVLAGASGFFDGLLTAIFNHGAAPKWAQAIVFLVDDLTGGGAADPNRGFSTLRVVGALAVAGLLLVLVVAPRPRHRATVHASSALVASGEGCGWWNAGGGAQVAKQGASTLACELAQVEATGTVSLQTLAACVGGVVSDLFADLTSILGYYTQPQPAPAIAGAVAMACGTPSAAPPYPGAPLCIPAPALDLLRARHAEAKLAVEQGAK